MNSIRLSDGATIDHVCTGTVKAGDIVVVGDDLAGIASCDAVAGDKIGLSVSGVFDFTTEVNSADAGDKVWWTPEPSGSLSIPWGALPSSSGAGSGNWDGFIGYAVQDAAGGKVRVLFCPLGVGTVTSGLSGGMGSGATGGGGGKG
jgi:predicted RecA/RadA family phage recombinase